MLVSGQHYDRSGSGVRMQFDTLNTSEARNMRFRMYDVNATTGATAIAVADDYEIATYGGESMYKATAQWTNNNGREYDGWMQVKLDFDEATQIIPSSVIVYDRVRGVELPATEYAVSGGVITLSHIVAANGEVYGVEVYFKTEKSAQGGFSLSDTLPGTSMQYWVLLLIVGCGLIIAGIVAKGKATRRASAGLLIILASAAFLLYYFGTFGAL
jgi:hypothetical protein